MKMPGLIGGVNWLSTIDYYRQISLEFNRKFGGSDYGKCIIYSLNYQEMIDNVNNGNFEAAYNLIPDAALKPKNSGADGIVICANTLHLFADKIEEAVKLPLSGF
jgi:aspartate racemase